MNRASQTGMKEAVLATAQRFSLPQRRKGAISLLCQTSKRNGKQKNQCTL